MGKFISILLVFLFSVPAFSREKKELPPYDLKRHEFAVSGAVYPGRYAFGYDFDFIPGKMYSHYYSSVAARYRDAETYNKERVTNTWTLSYTYNFTRVFSLAASVSYEGAWNEYYSRKDDSKVSTGFILPWEPGWRFLSRMSVIESIRKRICHCR